MKKFLGVLLVSLSLSLTGWSAPINLSKAKEEAVAYVKTGRYKKQIARVYHQAHAYLSSRLSAHSKNHEKEPLAVVMDLDETLLSNYQHMVENNFGGSMSTVEGYINKGDDPAIPEALNFARFAKQHGVSIFFVTGRTEDERESTERNLKSVGAPKWERLYMRPADYHLASIIPYKSNIRAEIEHQGYIVVESIGDQWSDIRGGHVEKGFKLPNPFYYIP